MGIIEITGDNPEKLILMPYHSIDPIKKENHEPENTARIDQI